METCPDSLLLLEHPHTYTLGSAADLSHLLMDEIERVQRGIAVYHVDRGGGLTYHGPGQVVGYPILRLTGHHLRTDVVAYVRHLEGMLIDVIAHFGLDGYRLPGYTGVWVGSTPHKIAAIGVRVTVRRVTLHGFALNVNTDLRYFQGIIPCGIADKPVISMQAVLGYPIEMRAVSAAIIESFGRVFNYEMQENVVHNKE